jgi:UDP-N-acetylmuramate--alanine ligase
MIAADFSLPLPASIDAIHFVGIGGSGMSGIARLFLSAGCTVSGSDRSENYHTESLRALGARISIGHDATNVRNVDAVVFTSALWPDNPEYARAVELGIPVLHRSQALAWLIADERLVAVAGAHGKTTSTGMMVEALLAMGEKPSFVNGGVIQSIGTSSGRGDGSLFVIEADESDGSFLLYSGAVALITNVDTDHLDHYGSAETFDDAFVQFADAARELVVISSDDEGARRVSRRLSHRNVVTFGEDPAADVRLHSVIAEGPVSFAINWRGQTFTATLRIPGHHNAVNAAGVFAVLVNMGFSPELVLRAIATFGVTERRFELHGVVRGVRVYDDYAHHPAEVAAALSAARSTIGLGRIIAVHQPHLYSRTQAMAAEFATTYEALADHTIVLDVHGAREDPVPGVTGALVSERFTDQSKVDFVPDWHTAAELAAATASDGDLIMTLSCGDVYRIIPQILEALARPEPGVTATLDA